MKEEIKHFRDFKKVYMITVLEGYGTVESPSREVYYIFEQDGQCVGKIDPVILSTHPTKG